MDNNDRVSESGELCKLKLSYRNKEIAVHQLKNGINKIGRSKENDIVIPAKYISINSEHGAIDVICGEYFVIDYKSSNGVFMLTKSGNQIKLRENAFYRVLPGKEKFFFADMMGELIPPVSESVIPPPPPTSTGVKVNLDPREERIGLTSKSPPEKQKKKKKKTSFSILPKSKQLDEDEDDDEKTDEEEEDGPPPIVKISQQNESIPEDFEATQALGGGDPFRLKNIIGNKSGGMDQEMTQVPGVGLFGAPFMDGESTQILGFGADVSFLTKPRSKKTRGFENENTQYAGGGLDPSIMKRFMDLKGKRGDSSSSDDDDRTPSPPSLKVKKKEESESEDSDEETPDEVDLPKERREISKPPAEPEKRKEDVEEEEDVIIPKVKPTLPLISQGLDDDSESEEEEEDKKIEKVEKKVDIVPPPPVTEKKETSVPQEILSLEDKKKEELSPLVEKEEPDGEIEIVSPPPPPISISKEKKEETVPQKPIIPEKEDEEESESDSDDNSTMSETEVNEEQESEKISVSQVKEDEPDEENVIVTPAITTTTTTTTTNLEVPPPPPPPLTEKKPVAELPKEKEPPQIPLSVPKVIEEKEKEEVEEDDRITGKKRKREEEKPEEKVEEKKPEEEEAVDEQEEEIEGEEEITEKVLEEEETATEKSEISSLQPKRKKRRTSYISKYSSVKSPLVLFTGIGDRPKKDLLKKLRSLGGEESEDMSKITHLVVDKIRRTKKFLCCLGQLHVHIVSVDWIEDSYEEKGFIREGKYRLKDPKGEKEHKLKLLKVYERREEMLGAGKKVFSGKKIFVSKNCRPPPKIMGDMVDFNGGKLCKSLKEADFVVCCDKDRNRVKRQTKDKVLYDKEFVLRSILRQVLDLDDESLRL